VPSTEDGAVASERGHEAAPDVNQTLDETRERLVMTEQQLGTALGELRVLQSELLRYQAAATRLDELARSRFVRGYLRVRRLGARATRRFRSHRRERS
jgi:hypothetical protein